MKFDAETVEANFPRSLLEREGTTAIMHMLADAFEMWCDDDPSYVLIDAAEKLRALAGPFEVDPE